MVMGQVWWAELQVEHAFHQEVSATWRHVLEWVHLSWISCDPIFSGGWKSAGPSP